MNNRKTYLVCTFILFIYLYHLFMKKTFTNDKKKLRIQQEEFEIWREIKTLNNDVELILNTFHNIHFWYFENNYADRNGLYKIGTYTDRAGGEIGFIETMHAILKFRKRAENDIVIDGGMNVGMFSLLAASMNYHVHSYEVNEVCVEFANKLFQTNFIEKNIILMKAGLSEKREKVSIPISNNCGGGTQIRQIKRSEQKIDLLSLDDMYYNTQDNIVILKIDIEGEEFATLRGAKLLLSTKRIKHIFMEFQPSVYGNDWVVLENGLNDILNHGYIIYQTFTWTRCNEFDGLQAIYPNPLGIDGPDPKKYDWKKRVHSGFNAGKLHKLIDVNAYLKSFETYNKPAGSNLWITTAD